MSSPIYDRAVQIQTAAREAIAADDDELLAAVLVTLNPLDVPKAAADGVVVISPPQLILETFEQTEGNWEITIVSGPAQHMETAWQRADAILNALRTTDLPLAVADPGSYTPPGDRTSIAAYIITLTETYQHQEDTL